MIFHLVTTQNRLVRLILGSKLGSVLRKEANSVPSYKERSYKERLVDFHVTKEQRLVD